MVSLVNVTKSAGNYEFGHVYWKNSQILCPLFFIKFLYFAKWKPFKNYEKNFSIFQGQFDSPESPETPEITEII